KKVCQSNCPAQEFAGLDAKGIDQIKLATLYAILTKSDFEPGFMNDTLSSGGEEGPWVMEVPPDLVERLAELKPRQRTAAGKKWAATEEFSPQFDDWPVEAVQQILQDLALLCQRAVAEKKSVLMWMCL